MDPLFGFVDHHVSSEHHQENPNTTEYTISYSTNPTQNFEAQDGSEYNASTATPVVHVVSENAQNEKQIYVIKLENILKEDSHQLEEDSEIRANFEVTDMETDKIDSSAQEWDHEYQEGSESISSNSNDDVESSENEDSDDEDVGFLSLSPDSVISMAQSVGVNLNEDVASQLGCCAVEKLRNIILAALQYSQNENAEALYVEHFSKAERLLDKPSLGHESVFCETGLKYAGELSVVDDGPEVDLYAALRQTNMSDITVAETEAVLNVHHMRCFDNKSERNNNSSNFHLYDEPVVVPNFTGKENQAALSESEDDAEVEDQKQAIISDSPAQELATVENRTEHRNDASGCDSSAPSEDNELPQEKSVEQLAAEYLLALKSHDSNVDEVISSTNIKQEENGELTKDTSDNGSSEESDEVAFEWEPYLQIVLEQVVGFNHYEDFNYTTSSSFQKILKDIRRNGVHPILAVLCDSFRDYLRHSNLSKSSLINVVSIIDAIICSRCQPTLVQLSDLASVLIEVIILPPPCEVHQFLANVFMRILKNCNELLTWTCTYVTEVLKGVTETPVDQLNESLKTAVHGALCLANGLEELKIQVAQEFGWHANILHFSTTHCNVFEGEAYYPSKQDSFLEEEILRFYHNFLSTYNSLVPPEELSRIREVVSTLYGERYLAFVPLHLRPISVKPDVQSSVNTPTKKVRCVFKKIIYQDKEIIVPYRKIIKSN